MKSFLVACIAAIVIAICFAAVLSVVQQPVNDAYSSPTSVRI
jgi:hypothetical protein